MRYVVSGLASAVTLVVLLVTSPSAAADKWIEIASPHFTVVSNSGEGTARGVAWQFEQIRTGIRAGWPWASADLDRPFVVMAVKNESTMRSFAPWYWEEKGNNRPNAVSASGLDRHFVLVRSDARADGPEGVNPYRAAFWGYAWAVLSDAFHGRLPYWFSRGLTELLSNTNVTDKQVQFGRVIPWHVDEMRRGRYPLAQFLTLTRESPELTGEVERRRYDAEAWALMHYLLYGGDDIRQSTARLNELARLVLGGTTSVAAVEQLFGSVDVLEQAYQVYLQHGVFRYTFMPVDARIDRKTFAVRDVTAADAAVTRAAFQATSGRPVEARAALAEARQSGSDPAEAYVVEGRLLEGDGKRDEARAMYERGVSRGSDNFWAYYRLVALAPRQGATPEALDRLRTLVIRAADLNPASANVEGLLGSVLLQMGRTDEAVAAYTHAVNLDPSEQGARLNLANALLRSGDRDGARSSALAARALAVTDAERAAAQQLLDRIGGGV